MDKYEFLFSFLEKYPNNHMFLEYLKVTIPVGSVVYLEWAFYEVTTVIVGML